MTLDDQKTFMQLFHSGCLSIMNAKAAEYAPDGIPLLDCMRGAVDANISIPQALWTLFNKHFAAIRGHFFLDRPATAEPMLSRCQDATNLFALLAFYETHRINLHAAWRAFWRNQPCECDVEPSLLPAAEQCMKHRALFWLERTAFAGNSPETLSPGTQKEQDSSPTATPHTGGIIRPARSRGRSATKEATRPGSGFQWIPRPVASSTKKCRVGRKKR